MKDFIQNQENILSRQISGFHIYCLSEPARIVYASENLCELLGCTQQELLGAEDRYAGFVHPADREAYDSFLRRLAEGTASVSACYRLVKRSGEVLHVKDTLTVSCGEDHVPMGYSVLADVTQLQSETENLRFLSDTIPCGFLKYTCGKTPRITYINDQMLRMLRFPEKKDAGFDALEMYKQNIFMMIPMEDRRRFAMYLRLVYRRGGPIAGEMTVLRCDGSRAHLFGWVTKSVDEQGHEEFQSACMDITERQHLKQEREVNRYLKALTEVYDNILEYDLPHRTVKCVHGQDMAGSRWVQDIPMQMEQATQQWISASIFREDQEEVRRFFSDFFQKSIAKSSSPPTIRYRVLSPEGQMQTCTGLLVQADAGISLFCSRRVPDTGAADSLRAGDLSPRDVSEGMRRLVMHFADGIAAFEVTGDLVTPLYASENAYDFFGISKDEWLALAETRTPVRTFVSRSKADYEAIAKLLESGEAEFTYYDRFARQQRRILAICSPREPDSSGTRYVMLYNISRIDAPPQETPHVRIRTFGYFDVFVDDKPIAFRNEKSKELLALLVDRRGGFVSSEEAIGFLWEDESSNPVTLARYRKVALRLKNTLEEYGVPDIMVSVNGQRRLATDKISCDLYDYLTGREEYAQLFKGSYLTNYSWGEFTLAELTGAGLY